MSTGNPQEPPTEILLDPRGPRFAAWITSAVLAAIVLLGFATTTGAGVLALVQAVVFAIGALAGPRYGPYGVVYRVVVAPRLGRPAELEPAAPVRFAQAVGLAFALAAVVGYLVVPGAAGLVVGTVAAASALVAAFLNAAFGLCLGCEAYLLYRRATRRPVPRLIVAPGADPLPTAPES